LEAGIGWLGGLGAPVLSRETGNPRTFGARLDPTRTVAALVGQLAASGGRMLTNTALEGLAVDPKGRVRGAKVVSGTQRWTVEADAVILASGGFAANPDLVGRHITRGLGRMRLRTHPRSTGDGFLAALKAGALESAGLDEFYGRNLPAPPAGFSPEQFVEVSQLYGRLAVALDTNGKRYADEAAGWSETSLTRATARLPGLRAWYILDGAGLQQRVRDREVGEMVEAARRVGGTVLRAGSIEGLADALEGRGVPRENALRTLGEYNAAVAEGRGGDLSPPRSESAAPVREPPFVAVEVAPTITHTIGGLAVDSECRVLRRQDRRPLPGLYAAGVEVGGASVGGYTSGLAAALVFGTVAAEAAFQHLS
jgi:succinate dehydrogenase/fumarate reductase flavoprotein subunit